MLETMQRLESMVRTLEADWTRGLLAAVTDENDIEPSSREVCASMWNTLKTLLFTTIMILQSALSTLVYVPQPQSSAGSPSEMPSPFSFSLTALHILSHLSFILPQFGGVTSIGEGSFSELKKVHYTALDILASSQEESERFVRELCEASSTLSSRPLPANFLHAKKAYVLACIEQLVSVLCDASIRNEVFPACVPHLSDPSHRETYESSHSVMLAILVSHAQQASEGKLNSAPGQTPFAEQIVPFYVRCLIENSKDDHLSTSQLCLAFAALVRSAGSFAGISNTSPSCSSVSAPSTSITSKAGDSFAWYCLDALLDAIRTLSSSKNEEQLHRLHLALIASVPSVSLTVLPKLFDEILVIAEGSEGQMRAEVCQALFKEVSENMGDAEKEYAMTWWYEHRQRLAGYDGSAEERGSLEDSTSLLSRL